jgi:hypothetical protein
MSHEKQMAAAKHLEEMGSGIMMGGGKNLMDQAFAGLAKEGAGYSAAGSNLSSIQGMIQGGQIQANDMRLADYYNAQFELVEEFKKQPDVLAEKLTKAFDKIFKEESEAQKAALKKQKQDELGAFYREKDSLQQTLEYLHLRQMGQECLPERIKIEWQN